MLGFFRRLTKSKAGVVITFVMLGIIALAFGLGDITGTGGAKVDAANAASVGDDAIPETELVAQVKSALQGIQQGQPTADMAGLIRARGVERVLDQLIERRALARFGEAQGMVVSRRALDGEIAGIPGFRGPDGKFSQAAYDGMLAQQKLTDAQVRDDLTRERLIALLTAPVNGAARAGTQLALPYASSLLERRRGTVALIPAAAVATGPAPTDAQLAAFYAANRARYTLPERRAMRFALVTPEAVKARATPTDADLAAAYRADPARFAAAQHRSAQVVIVLDQASAAALVAKARAGTALDVAARAAGLEARTLTKLDRTALAAQTSPALADALFGATKGAVVGPLRAGGSFTIAVLTEIDQVPARTLDQARAELLPEVAKAKIADTIGRLNDTLDTAASEGSSFDELVADQKLSAIKTPALMRSGVDPLNPSVRPPPALAPIIQAGFAAEQGDPPQIVPVGAEGAFALVVLDSVQPAAPRPLADIRADVARAFVQQRAMQAARGIAAAVVARLDAGTPLPAALAATGLRLPPPRPIDVPRAALTANQRGPEPALALLFAMAPGKAKLLADPRAGGWQVLKLDTITPGDARRDPRITTGVKGELSQLAGGELVEQFGQAIRKSVTVKRNDAAVARAKAELSGQTPDGTP